MRVAWLHTFSPHVISSGCFMHTLAAAMPAVGVNVDLIQAGPLTPYHLIAPVGRGLRQATAPSDLLHAQYGSGCGALATRFPGPKLLTLRGSDWYGGEGFSLRSKLRSAAVRAITRWSLRDFDLVIVVSRRMKTEIEPLQAARSLLVLPDGIDLQRFKPRSREHARTLLGAGGDKSPWVLFASVTQGNPIKRPWLAHEAMAMASKKMPSIRLVSITGVPHERVPLYVAASNLVLVTSTHEGWPNIVKEGLACNIPFVSTDVSDLAKIAAVEQSCYISAPNAKMIANGILMSLEIDKPGDLRRHVEPMGIDRIASGLAASYARVLSQAITAHSSQGLRH